MSMSLGDDEFGAKQLFASSWVRKVIFRLYFLCGALLTLGAYAAFWASFGAWTWAVLLPAMALVRPLAAHACGINDEDNGLGTTMLSSLFVGPLWLFVDYPVALVDMAKEGKTAAGVLLCGVLSAAEAWLMIALCVGVPSSNLRDTALYYPDTAAAAAPFTNATNASITNATYADAGAGADGVVAPLDTLLANGVLGFAAVLTVLKVLFGYVVVRHWQAPKDTLWIEDTILALTKPLTNMITKCEAICCGQHQNNDEKDNENDMSDAAATHRI